MAQATRYPHYDPDPMHWIVIVNPRSGRGKTRKLLPDIRARLIEVGLDHEVVLSTDPEHPAKIATAAFAAGHGVVACGGDGLVGLMAGMAAEAKGVLGVIPTGSGNDFARHLGLDHKNPLAAIDVLVAEKIIAVDLGRANDYWFGAVAGTGFDAEVSRWANTVKRVGGTTLYIAAVLRTLATFKPHKFRVTIDDGEPREMRAWLVAIANGWSYGGGMKVAPDASIHDGLLDVVVVGPVSRLEFLKTFPKVFKGTHTTHPAIEITRCKKVTVESLIPEVPIEIYADGERVGPLPATVVVMPKALRVAVP